MYGKLTGKAGVGFVMASLCFGQLQVSVACADFLLSDMERLPLQQW